MDRARVSNLKNDSSAIDVSCIAAQLVSTITISFNQFIIEETIDKSGIELVRMAETVKIVNGGTPKGTIVNGSTANGQPPKEKLVSSEAVHDPPDGGARAWLVMAGAFLCNGVLFGVINTYSVVYLSLQKQLQELGDSEASSKAGE